MESPLTRPSTRRPSMATLKTRLEAIWNEPGVQDPLRKARWRITSRVAARPQLPRDKGNPHGEQSQSKSPDLESQSP